MIGGVCGGLAEFTGISALWFRLLFLILLLPGGSGLRLPAAVDRSETIKNR